MKQYIVLFLIILLSSIIFIPTVNTYFSQDDWVFLSHVYKRPWIDVFRYYPEAFYRPIGQQLFFKIGSVLFGLNPFGYHAIGLLIHSMNIWLIWKVIFGHSGASLRATRLQTPEAPVRFDSQSVSGKSATGGQVESPARLLLIFLYAIHPVHLIALNWLTQVDIEIAVMFSLLTILTFDKHFLLSVVTLIAALLSHETAAMLPIIMLLKGQSLRTQGLSFSNEKDPTLRSQGRIFRTKRVMILLVISFSVLLAKYLFNPFSFQSDYSLGFQPLQLFSTTKWYVLRALFLPEGIRTLPVAIQALSVLSAGLIILLFRWKLLRALLVFIVGLAPVLLFSQHVFSVYAVLPVLWMVLELGKLTSERVILEGAERPIGSREMQPASPELQRGESLRPSMTLITAFVLSVTSFLTVRSVIPTHWTTTRGEISRKLTEEFDASVKRSDLAARSDLMKRMDFPPASEPSFASMMGRQFEVLKR